MCRQMPVAPDPSAEFLSPFQRFNPSELALPVQPRRAGGERAAAAAVAPSLPPSLPPACRAAGTGRSHPGPLQGEKASGSEDAGRTARCPQAEPEQQRQQQPRLGAWHWYSRL